MDILLIGIGGAGCRIVNQFRRLEKRSFGRDRTVTTDSIGIDTTGKQLSDCSRINTKIIIGAHLFNGKGSNGNLSKGVKATRAGIHDITDPIAQPPHNDYEAIVIIGSLSGGTGGTAAVIADKFRHYDVPIYGVGILPGEDEYNRYTLNATRSVKSFSRTTDNLFLFDNTQLGVREPKVPDEAESVDFTDIFNEANQHISRTLFFIFTADNQTAANKPLNETTLKTSQLMKILETGGLSTIGYDSMQLPKAAQPGIRGWIRHVGKYITNPHSSNAEQLPHPTDSLPSTYDQSNLMTPATPKKATGTLNLLIGPEQYLHPQNAVDASKWIDNHSMSRQTIAACYPRNKRSIGVLSIFSDIPIPERIRQMETEAAELLKQYEQQASPDPRQRDVFENMENAQIDPII